MPLTSSEFGDLARAVARTAPDEFTCDEWLAVCGGYADAVAVGGPVPDHLRLAAHHLTVCPECDEEFRAVLSALGPSDR